MHPKINLVELKGLFIFKVYELKYIKV